MVAAADDDVTAAAAAADNRLRAKNASQEGQRDGPSKQWKDKEKSSLVTMSVNNTWSHENNTNLLMDRMKRQYIYSHRSFDMSIHDIQ